MNAASRRVATTGWPKALLPRIVAESVYQSVSVFLGGELPPRYAEWLMP